MRKKEKERNKKQETATWPSTFFVEEDAKAQMPINTKGKKEKAIPPNPRQPDSFSSTVAFQSKLAFWPVMGASRVAVTPFRYCS